MNAGAGTSLAEGKSSIRDLVDLEKMRGIFEKFTQATGFVIDLLDHPGMRPLITAGKRGLCSEFYKACPASAELCGKSSRRLLGCLGAPGQLAVEVCGHGLAYCATPIIINGNHIASLTAGQVLLEAPDLERFRNHAALYGFEEGKYLEALKEVPVERAERLASLTAFLGELVSVMAEQGLAEAELKEKSDKLEKLVLSNAAAEAALKESEEKFRDL
ncbi:MAG: PocR ligand-binding domain-containing protein, partial [Elusimicrobiota bacterium]|nr:PocR ligand-binding domain-containing protein [Elusimicrobiota bacterium]